MEQLRTRLNDHGDAGHRRTWRDEMSSEFKDSCPTLSYEHRLYGFGACIGIGFLLSILGAIYVATAHYTLFAVYYSIGSICGLMSTAFLVGPCRQLSLMFSAQRWIATAIYLFAIVLTLFFGLYPGLHVRLPIVLVCVIFQYCAALWYSLSYIPYARSFARKFINGTCCGGEEIV